MIQTEDDGVDIDPSEKQKLNLQIQQLQAELENMNEEIEQAQNDLNDQNEERIELLNKIEKAKTMVQELEIQFEE